MREPTSDVYGLWSDDNNRNNVYSATKTRLLTSVTKSDRVVHVVKLHVYMFSVPCCDVRCEFRIKNDVRFVLTPICFVGVSCFIDVLYIYLYLYLVSVGCEAGTASPSGAPEFIPGY